MNAAPRSLIQTSREFAAGWNAFFHASCDARVCAAIRVMYATLVLIHWAVLYPDLDLWFTAEGYLPREFAEKVVSPFSWSLLNVWADSSVAVHTCYWLAVVSTVLLWLGFAPRINACCLFLWLNSFQNRNSLIMDGEDTLMRLMAFFLIWMPTGRCWSVNALLRGWWKRQEPQGFSSDQLGAQCLAPGWGLRLLQLEMAGMFFTAGLLKLAGDSWFNGTAMYYVSRLDDHFGRFPVANWVFDTPWVVAGITWSVIVVEIAAPILVWFRETRLPCLLIVAAFHLANEWTMNLFLFHWLMLCGWLAFLRPEDFAFLRRFGRRPEPRS